MPLLDLGADVIAKTKAKASVANAKWNAIATLLNVTKLDSANIQNLAIITALINDGAVTGAKVDPALLAQIGANDGTNVRRGKSIIATEETRTNSAYGFMSTHDVVSSVVLPTNGLLRITFQGLIKCSSGSANPAAALFVGANQVVLPAATGGAPVAQAAYAYGTYAPLLSSPLGLQSAVQSGPNPAGGDSSNVTTGQLVGSPVASINTGGSCLIFAAAGTYDVSVQFRANTGTVFAKERKLWVEAVGF